MFIHLTDPDSGISFYVRHHLCSLQTQNPKEKGSINSLHKQTLVSAVKKEILVQPFSVTKQLAYLLQGLRLQEAITNQCLEGIKSSSHVKNVIIWKKIEASKTSWCQSPQEFMLRRVRVCPRQEPPGRGNEDRVADWFLRAHLNMGIYCFL